MDYPEPQTVIDILNRSASLNRDDPYRKGHILLLPDYGQVVMTGDLHGCRHNFRKLQWFSDLQHSIHRHIIIHELIHASNGVSSEEDDSFLLLVQAAQWKIQFPEQVHFLLGNHDLAQITSREITKNGYASIANFNKWIHKTFGTKAEELIDTLGNFLLTLPLAARTNNRIWMSHSLPSEHKSENLDLTIFERAWQRDDLIPGGSVYEFVWGRDHSPSHLDKLAELLDTDYFIVGHQSQPTGCSTVGNREIILASDHYQGCFMPIDLSATYTFDTLTKRIKSFMDLPDDIDVISAQ